MVIVCRRFHRNEHILNLVKDLFVFCSRPRSQSLTYAVADLEPLFLPQIYKPLLAYIDNRLKTFKTCIEHIEIKDNVSILANRLSHVPLAFSEILEVVRLSDDFSFVDDT